MRAALARTPQVIANPLDGREKRTSLSYAVGGRQYVAIAAGSVLFVYALRQ